MTIPCSWNPVEFSRRLFTDLHTQNTVREKSVIGRWRNETLENVEGNPAGVDEI